MSKTISDEKIKLSIVIDGNTAQKELYDLEKATRKITEETKQLTLEKGRLERANKTETEEYKKLTAEIRSNNKVIKDNKAQMSQLQNQIGITGMTMSQLRKKAFELKMTLEHLVPGSADHQRFSNDLKQISARMNELSGKAKEAKFSLSSIADGFNRYQGLALSFIAGLTGVVFSIQKIIDINGKLSDAQADVRKTTGMTKEEVDDLTKSFGLLETRTSRIDLLKIAEQGGRLGIPKAEIQDFVKSMNIAAVALGDSFTGGVDAVAEKLGKIKFLFKETEDMNVEQAYMKIGSAINDLGANGVASEENIAEFTKRIGSLTDVLKPTVQETLALGTAFEESGIEAETSSRAYNIFMKQASTETAKFGKVMNLSAKEVERLINKNPMEFMLDFAKGMRGMDATETAKTLDYLGINADGANKVIGAMGNNFERFHELIDLSNASFSSGTSLINEYNVKNENLAATLEKVGKKIAGWFSSETFTNWLSGAVMWISKFIGASEDADGSVGKWKNTLAFAVKILGILTAAIVTNVAWQKLIAMWTTRNTEATILYNVAEKARAFMLGLSTIATQAQALAVALATRNMAAAKEATLALGTAMKTTPWGFILSAMAAVVVAYQMFSTKVTQAAAIQKTLSDIQTESAKSIAKEKTELELLTRVATDNNSTKEDAIAAINRLNEIIPDNIGFLTLQNIKTQEGTDILKKYTDEIYKNARARAVQSTYDKLVAQRVETEGKNLGEYQSDTGKFFKGDKAGKYKNDEDIKKGAYEFVKTLKGKDGKFLKPGTKEFYSMFDLTYKNLKGELQTYIDEKNSELAILDAQIKALEPEITKNTIDDLKKGIDPTKSDFVVPGDESGKGKKDPNSTQEEIDRLRFESIQKFLDSIEKLKRQYQDESIAAMQDGYEKEMAIEHLRYERQVQDLEKQKIHEEEFVKLDEAIAKAKKDKDVKLYNHLLQQKEVWGNRNLEVDKKIDELEISALALHNLKKAVITEKAGTEELKKLDEKYHAEKLYREGALEIELSSMGDNEARKEKRRKEFAKAEFENEKQYLLDKLKKLEQIFNGAKLDGIDFSLLTDKEKKELEKQIEYVKSLLNSLKNGGGDKSEMDQYALNNVDILGYSIQDWANLQQHLKDGKIGIQDMATAVGILSNMWGTYSQYLEASENAALTKYERSNNRRIASLKHQLDNGMISQESYQQSVDRLNRQYERKKFEMELKQAKRARKMALIEIALNTAKGVMSVLSTGGGTAYADFGVSAGILSALVIATGAIQAATVMKKPLPTAEGFEDGLYPNYVKRQQDGKIFKANYEGETRSGMVNKPSVYLAGERGPEMIIDDRSWKQIHPEVKSALIRELQGIRGFEKGHYKDGVLYSGNTSTKDSGMPGSGDDRLLEMTLAVLSETTIVLRDLRDKGVIAKIYTNDYSSLNKLNKSLKDVEERLQNSKR
jgi:TP901 family phage tail tape measure protein